MMYPSQKSKSKTNVKWQLEINKNILQIEYFDTNYVHNPTPFQKHLQKVGENKMPLSVRFDAMFSKFSGFWFGFTFHCVENIGFSIWGTLNYFTLSLVVYGGTTSGQRQLVLQSGIVTLLFWDSNIRHPNFQFESMSLKQKSKW